VVPRTVSYSLLPKESPLLICDAARAVYYIGYMLNICMRLCVSVVSTVKSCSQQ
jgi:hypothetical protein